MTESQPCGIDEGPAQKVSVSMPAGRIAAVRARTGTRGFSAYVSAAVERQLQRDLIEELLQEHEAQAGPIPQEMLDHAAQAFRAAEALVDLECGASRAEGEDASTEGETWRGRRAR
ncbi:hypothetical protein [Streptomyces thermolineatus]